LAVAFRDIIMAKKKRSSRVKGKAARAKKSKPSAAQSVAAQLPAPTPEQIAAAKKKFVLGIQSRGEAVPAGQPLPPGATHEIVGYEPDGTPILKRKRFSLR
jgi:hypothetical protein